MLEKIKQLSIQKHTNKTLEMRDISSRNTPMQTLGILIDETNFNQFEVFNNFGASVGLLPKDVEFFSFTHVRKSIPTLRQNHISNKEFSWRGEIESENAKEFLNKDFDVLVGFYNGKNNYLEALVARSKAKFKIGFADADKRLFDLILKIDPKNVTLALQEVNKYLKILGKI